MKVVTVQINPSRPYDIFNQELPLSVKLQLLQIPSLINKESKVFFYIVSIVEMYYTLEAYYNKTTRNELIQECLSYIETRSFYYSEKTSFESSASLAEKLRKAIDEQKEFFNRQSKEGKAFSVEDDFDHFFITLFALCLLSEREPSNSTLWGIFIETFDSFCSLVDNKIDIDFLLSTSLKMSIETSTSLGEALEDLTDESAHVLH